jgi:hypothetical protein
MGAAVPDSGIRPRNDDSALRPNLILALVLNFINTVTSLKLQMAGRDGYAHGEEVLTACLAIARFVLS